MGNNFCKKPSENQILNKNITKLTAASNLLENSEIKLADFKILKLLGQGSFGKVYLVKKRGSRKGYFAMKVLSKDYIIKKGQFDHIMTERRVLA
jgi:serine/threonine protein kinase